MPLLFKTDRYFRRSIVVTSTALAVFACGSPIEPEPEDEEPRPLQVFFEIDSREGCVPAERIRRSVQNALMQQGIETVRIDQEAVFAATNEDAGDILYVSADTYPIRDNFGAQFGSNCSFGGFASMVVPVLDKDGVDVGPAYVNVTRYHGWGQWDDMLDIANQAALRVYGSWTASGPGADTEA